MKLETLRLRSCRLSDQHFMRNQKLLGVMLGCTAHLDLSNNTLGPGFADLLSGYFESFLKDSRLVELDIGHNTFRSRGAAVLCASLEDGRGWSTLKVLSLAGMPIGQASAACKNLGIALAEGSLTSLRSLDVSWTKLGEACLEDFISFSDLLGVNTGLRSLNLWHNFLSAGQVMRLGQGLLSNHTLIDIRLGDGNNGRTDNLGFLIPTLCSEMGVLKGLQLPRHHPHEIVMLPLQWAVAVAAVALLPLNRMGMGTKR